MRDPGMETVAASSTTAVASDIEQCGQGIAVITRPPYRWRDPSEIPRFRDPRARQVETAPGSRLREDLREISAFCTGGEPELR